MRPDTSPVVFDAFDDLRRFFNMKPTDMTEDANMDMANCDTDSQAHSSDDEDILCMRCAETTSLSASYQTSFLGKDR